MQLPPDGCRRHGPAQGIQSRAEDPQAVAAQTEALVHVAARDPVLPVPRVLAMRDGGLILRWKGAEGVLLMRLLSYLPGTPLARASRPAA
ncbi:MAG: phosphotransferase [Janthinobacterium lividum]